MTFPTHAYVGAVAYHALSRAIGLEAGWAAPTLGAVLGSAPDTVDWIGAKLGFWPRWWMYSILHKWKPAVIVEAILVAPGLHILFDLLSHYPAIPRPGTSADYEMPLFKILGTTVTRRDLQWAELEVMVVALATLVLIWTT